VQRSAVQARGDLRLRHLGLGHRDIGHHQHVAAECVIQGGDAIDRARVTSTGEISRALMRAASSMSSR
jgi:hypothetical protein